MIFDRHFIYWTFNRY